MLQRSLEKMGWPPITLVTPVLNCAAYIEQTIQSVISQHYPNLEYFIIDGGSTDGTLEIIQAYAKEITGWISEPDSGMYDALNKGFAKSSNEIMGWISGTDILHPGGLFVVGSVFRAFPDVEWITGTPTVVDESGATTEVRPLPHWSRVRFLAGANKYIQQESTFWRRSLWEKAGGYVDASRRIASDFELWVRFFRHARLYSVSALIGAYRAHANSIGLEDMAACHRVHSQVIDAELESLPWGGALKRIQRVSSRLEVTPKVGFLWQPFVKFLKRRLYATPGSDWPPVIEYDQGRGWVKKQP